MNASFKAVLKVNILLFQSKNLELQFFANVDGPENLRLERVVHGILHLLGQQSVTIDVDLEFFLHLQVVVLTTAHSFLFTA